MLKRFYFFALSLCLVSLLASSSCRADEITATMRKADTQLETRVTLRSPHILLGELLERLSKQSGVPLIADDWSTVGSDSVTVSLRNVPLADAMNALWSLFSYQHAEWDWQRRTVKGQPGKYIYTLARPNYARFLAEHLQEQVQVDFEAQAQELFDALNMPHDQLKEAAKTNLLFSSLLDDGRVRPGMEILASLPPETLQNVLQNHQSLSVPVSQLSPEAQASLNASWDWEDSKGIGYHHPDGSVQPLPRADRISVYTFNEPDLAAPGLYVDSGRGSGEYFGGGFMQKDWQKKIAARWTEPGDDADNPASAHVLAAPKKSPPADSDTPHPLADYLLRFAEAAQVPLMARVPHTMDTQTPSDTVSQAPTTNTVRTFLAQAQQGPLLMDHKWRGGVLLMTCQNWFVGQSEDARLPWAEVKRLRDAEAASDGFLTLDNIAHAANVLNDAQMTVLGQWFLVMRQAAQWHNFLAFYDRNPEYHSRVLSAKGDDWQIPENMVNTWLNINALRVTHPNLRLQIQQRQDTQSKPPMHHLMFVVRDDDGVRPLAGQGFGYEAHEYATGLKVSEKWDTAGAAPGKQSSAAK